MRMHQRSFSLLPIFCILGTVLLSACTGTPALPKDQAERELVSFMLDYTLRQELGVTGSYSQSGGHVWADAPEDAALIVWAPATPDLDDTSINFLNTDAPSRIWWFANAELAEVNDKAEAIEAFRQLHFSSSSSGWGYYEFGILSLSDGNRTARVYLGVSCGPLCGEGTIYTLQRDDTGKWEIKETEPRWIS